MTPDPRYTFAVIQADRFLDKAYTDPQQQHRDLVHLFVGAMIEESEQAKKRAAARKAGAR